MNGFGLKGTFWECRACLSILGNVFFILKFSALATEIYLLVVI